ncbi:transcriptional regulator [Sorangium sp. So ce854]|uniref:transcriptional regulator n=1 Tax=Sorangium sp. So ce854 TaxID=3133322 RepID=UPI003F627533
MTLRRDHALSCTTLLIIACGLAGCGKAATRPAAAPESAAASDAATAPLTLRRSADDIILAAKLPPETAPRASFEIHRLDAHAVCSAAQARLSASVNVNVNASARADAGAGPSALTVSSLVIGGLGLAGGITTTVLAAGLEAPPMPAPGTPSLPDAEPPDIEGKTGVVVAGVLTGVVVVGAVVGTLLLAGGDDDEDEQRKRKLDLDLGGPGARGLRDALRDFELACPDEPAEDALAGCIERARALRRTCAAR